VTGDGSQWNNSDSLSVGESGMGTLNVEAGGVVSNTTGSLGFNIGASGTATVTGSGSQWNNSSSLVVGLSGTGTLNVADGGIVSNTFSVIGNFSGSTGTATVTGGGSEWNNSINLVVGNSGTGTLNVADGGVVSNLFGYLGFDTGSTGTATVTGDGSQWNNSSSLYVGGSSSAAGGTGSLTITDDGLVDVAGAFKIWDQGTVTLDGGSLNANAGLDASAGVLDFRDGTLTVTGGAFLPNAGGPSDDYSIDGPSATEMPHLVLGAGATANIGDDLFVGSSNQGQLTVTGGGVVSNTFGRIGDSPGSTGAATVTGGGSQWNNSSSLYVGYSGTGTLNVAAGGVVSNTAGYLGRFAGSTGTATVTGSGSQWNDSSSLFVGYSGTGTLNVADGGVVSNTFGYLGLNTGSTGAATVTGGGSEWNNSSSLYVGYSGTGTLNVADGGLVSNTSGNIGYSTDSTGTATVTGGGSEWNNSSSLFVGYSGTGTLNVAAGGVVSNAGGYLGRLAGSSGTATVTGSGSQWNTSNSLYVGGSSSTAGGTGSLTITDDGLVDVDGTFKIWGQGTLTIDDGSVVANSLAHNDGGTFNFVSGSLTVLSGIQVGDPNGISGSVSMNVDQNWITPATTSVGAGRTLALNGGHLQTDGLSVFGSFFFNSGTLELTGGSVTGIPQLNVPTNGTLRATGVLDLPVSAAAGSQIVATGDLTLGDASQTAGFYVNGNVSIADHTLTLADANDAVFDSGANAMLGDGGSPGTLAAANGLTLDFGGNITGHGTVDTPDSAATPLVNNGHIAGNSGAEPITLAGYVKGVGTLDNVVITGTDAPGFSPATVVRGSVVYGGVLEIEIGDTVPGDFDQINHILGAGIAELGGALDVSLIGGFSPALDDSFAIITANGGVSGTFSTLADELPALSSGLEWAIDYDTNNVVLSVVTAGLPGDYNQDGTVNAADYTVWRNNLGSLTALPNDNTAGVGEDDYARWKMHFGETAGSGSGIGSNAAVPEPATLVGAFVGVILLLIIRRR
jgi:T5SS/PEP-CTERM-associated repeat protein